MPAPIKIEAPCSDQGNVYRAVVRPPQDEALPLPKQSIDEQIHTRIDIFVKELSFLVREAAVEAVEQALRQGGSPITLGTTRKASRRKAATKTRRKTSRKKATGKRIRRSADDIAKVSERVLAYVKANPGTRMEAIAKALRKDTKDLRRSVQDLLAAKKLRTKGQKRGTEYYAGANRNGAKKEIARKVKKKAVRRKAKKAA